MAKRKRKREERRKRKDTDIAPDWRARWAARLEAAAWALLIVVLVGVLLAIDVRALDSALIKEAILVAGALSALGGSLVAAGIRGRLSWTRSPVNPAAWVFGAICFVSLVWSSSPGASTSEAWKVAGCGAVYATVVLLVREERRVRLLLWSLCAANVALVAYAFGQHWGWDPIAWVHGSRRVFSTLGNSTFFAGYLLVSIPLMLWLALTPRRNGSNDRETSKRPRQGDREVEGKNRVIQEAGLRIVPFVVFVCSVLALFWTYTRAAWGGMAIGGLLALTVWVAWRWRDAASRRRLVVGAGAVVLLAVVLASAGYRSLPEAERARLTLRGLLLTGSERFRQRHWRVAWELFRDRPVVGGGLGTYRVHSAAGLSSAWYETKGAGTEEEMFVPGYAHNLYLNTLADQGVLGGLVLLWLVFAAVWAWKLAVGGADVRWVALATAAGAGVVALWAQNFFAVSLQQSGVAAYYWLALGLITVASGKREQASPGTVRLPAEAALLATLGVVSLGLVAGADSINACRASRLLKSARTAIRSGHMDAGLRAAREAAARQPSSMEAHYAMAYVLGNRGDVEGALKEYEAALRLAPDTGDIEYNLGCAYTTLGELDQAEIHLRRAAVLMPTPHKLCALAKVLCDRGKGEEALGYARRALGLQRTDPRNWSAVTSILYQMKRYDEAIAHVREAFEKEGLVGWADGHRILGDLFYTTGRYKEAAEEHRKAILIDPDLAAAYYGLAHCQMALREPIDLVANTVGKGLSLEPEHIGLLLALANTQLACRDYPAARATMHKVIRTDPSSAEAAMARRALEEVLAQDGDATTDAAGKST